MYSLDFLIFHSYAFFGTSCLYVSPHSLSQYFPLSLHKIDGLISLPVSSVHLSVLGDKMRGLDPPAVRTRPQSLTVSI